MNRHLQIGLLLLLPLLAFAAHAGSDHDHGHKHTGASAGERHSHDDDDDHDHDHDHDGDDDHADEWRVTISAAMAQATGIATAVAGPGVIERHLQLYGRLTTPPDRQARIRARFAGVVTAVGVNVGDTVKRGEQLATVESDESLRSYALRAPIDGVVQTRATSVGETTGGEPLFTLVDQRQLWAELKVFPNQRAQIAVGQSLHVVHGDNVRDGRIDSVMPASGGEPFVLARVVIDNGDGRFAAGDLVAAQVDVERVEVALVVDSRALQTLDDAAVVFVRQGDDFEARALTLGRSDGRYSEVLGGLQAGEHYVVQNSYLIKADIEKSGAAHEH